MPVAWDQFESVDAPTTDVNWQDFEPVKDEAPASAPFDESKIKLSPYDQATMDRGGVKPPSGMESGTELTTALGQAGMRVAAPVLEPVNRALSYAGNVARAIPADIAESVAGNEKYYDMLNLGAAALGEPMPIDEQLKEASSESPGWAVTGKVAQGIAGMIPTVMAFGGLPAAAQKVALAGFTVKQLSDFKDASSQLGDELGKPKEQQDPDKITSLVSELAQTGLFAGAGIYGGRKMIAPNIKAPPARIGMPAPELTGAEKIARPGVFAPDQLRAGPLRWAGEPLPLPTGMAPAPSTAQLAPPAQRDLSAQGQIDALMREGRGPAPSTATPPTDLARTAPARGTGLAPEGRGRPFDPKFPEAPVPTASGKYLNIPKGAKPHPQQALLDDIIQEGVKRSDAEALIAGTKTVKQVVDENLNIVTPSRDFSELAERPNSSFGHADAMEEGYRNAIARLSQLLDLHETRPPEGGAPVPVPTPPKPTAPTGAAVVPDAAVVSKLGLKFDGTQAGAGIKMPSPEQLSKMPPEERKMYEAIAAQQGDQWAFTPQPGSEIPGRTFYVRKGASPEEIRAAYDKKLAQEKAAQNPPAPPAPSAAPTAAPKPVAPASSVGLSAPVKPEPTATPASPTASLVNPPQGPTPAFSGIPIPGVEAVLDRVTESAKALPAGIRNAWRSASMQSLPRITDSNRLAGEAGVRLDASRTVARAKGIEFAGKVTDGIKDKTFDLKFGTALTEDNLRDLKRQAEETARTATDPAEQMAAQTRADAVSTMIGQPNSPFATEAEYQSFMRTPEAQQALAKHIALWDTDKDPIFRQAMDLDPDQPLPTRGAQFGARVNLKNVLRDQGTRTTVGPAVRSPLIRATATLKRTDPFGRAATGSGSYEGSYQEIMANGFAREYPVAKQHEFIRALVDAGDAKITRREFDPEAEIKGESTKGYPLKMKPWTGQYLQIRKSLAPEYEDVSGLSASIRAGPYSAVADALTRSSIMGLSEGSTHAGNLLTQVFTGLGPTSNPLINAVIKSTGRADVLYSLPKVIINAFSDRKADMLKLAEIGAAKEPYHGAIGWFITKIDRGVRLYSADVYKKMAEKGWVEDTETGLREYVNQVGQYSKRLQPRWIQVLRSTGVQPFATAMQTFNVQGLRTMAGAPGAKAPSNLAALALRADKAAGILGFAVAVTALNYLVSGTAAGPPGTRLGAIGWIGDDGRLHQFDAGMLTGFTRGARISGVQGFVEAKRSGLGTGSALLAGAQGAGNTAISAATGPANRFGFMAITGKRPSLPPVQEAPVAVPQSEEDFSVIKSQVAKNILEAVKQANPIADATVRVMQGKYEEAATRQLSRYTPRTGMATETIEALPKIVQAGELHNYTDALAKEARKQPLGFDRNTFVREKLDEDNLDPAMRAKAMRELQMKGVFKYK